MINSLLGTPHWPGAKVTKGGILFLEDVNEHPYRIERSLLQLHQAGVLGAQKAVLLGAFSAFNKSPLDRGYSLKTVVAHLRSVTRTPILTGLPFGHVPTKVCLPVGAKVTLAAEGRDAFLLWGHRH
jgi:muramoyltetrapeptide carboxypeptidase